MSTIKTLRAAVAVGLRMDAPVAARHPDPAPAYARHAMTTAAAPQPGTLAAHPELGPTPAEGLREDEALSRRAGGLGNAALPPTTRTYAQILRENTFTFVNNILFVLGLALVLVGRPTDAVVSL